VQRAPKRLTVEGTRRFDVAQVEIPVDPLCQRLLVAVEHRPVDEEESLLCARLPDRLAEIGRLALSNRLEAMSFREIGIPENVVLDERAPRPEHEDDVGVSRRNAWKPVQEVGKRPVEDPAEDGVARQLRCRRAPANLVPRDERCANVHGPARLSRSAQSLTEIGSNAFPGERRRAVHRDDARAAGGQLRDRSLVTAHRLGARDGITRVRVVAQARRSSVSAALHEKSPLPSGAPVHGW
jgi:hypothetical protein